MSKRKKIILLVLISIILFGIGIFSWLYVTGKISLKASGFVYKAKLISQQPKGTINLNQGEFKKIIISYKNEGTSTWENSGNQAIYLETKENSKFWFPSELNEFYKKVADAGGEIGWALPWRIVLNNSKVSPGNIGNFVFFIQAPLEAGTYKEKFYLVNNSGQKIANTDVDIIVKVSNKLADETLTPKGEEVLNAYTEEDPSKKVEMLKELSRKEESTNPDQAKAYLEEAKETAEKIVEPEKKEKSKEAIKEQEEEINKLEKQKKEAKPKVEEEKPTAGGEEKAEEIKNEAKTVQSPQVTKTTTNKPLKVAGVTVGGIAGGAAIGAGVGTAVPGIGTAIGAIGGGILGGLAGLIGGLFGF